MANQILNVLTKISDELDGRLEVGISAGADPALETEKKIFVSTPFLIAEAADSDRIDASIAYSISHLPDLVDVPLKVQIMRVAGVVAVHAFNWLSEASTDLKMAESRILGTHVSNIQVTDKDVRDAATVIIAAKIHFFATNHHVGQGCISGFAKKAVQVVYNATPDELVHFTTHLHTIAHWADSRAVFEDLRVAGVGAVVRLRENARINALAARDVTIRLHGFPAGTAKIAFAIAAGRRFLHSAIAPYVALSNDLREIPDAARAIKRDPLVFHVGAHFLTGRPRNVAFDEICDRVLGRLVSYIKILYPKSSLAKSSVATVGAESYEDFSDSFVAIVTAYKIALAEPAEEVIAKIKPNIELEEGLDIAAIQEAFDNL